MAGRPASPSSSELLSGPDLGGGYLHQLSIDRHGETSTFTHHAQVGGQDAAGPPRGSLDRLGFVHPASPCMFGGPRCWHRRYLLPLADAATVRFTYQRYRLVLTAMLDQVYGDLPVPVSTVLPELVARLEPTLSREGIPWHIGGSTSALLLGAAVRPNDIDVGTSRPGVDRIGQLLREYLIEPVAPTDGSDGRPVRGGRAFVGTPAEGVRVEWAVPLQRGAPDDRAEFGGDPSATATLEARVGGMSIRVSRPEYGLVRAAERGQSEVTAVWVELVRRIGADLGLLDTLLGSSSLAGPARDALRAALS